MNPPLTPRETVLRNFMAGLTTSFVVVSLGAAFGVMSGRGAFAGMLSAAIIAIIVSALGGTRIAVSGPTGPMTTVTAVLVAFAHDEGARRFPELPPEQFVSIVLLGTSALVLAAAALRLARLIYFVPQVVISGFMNGIAVLIWVDCAKKAFGVGDTPGLAGAPWQNLSLIAATLLIAWRAGPLLKRLTGRLHALMPATLAAIVLMTGLAAVLGLDVERTTLVGLHSLADAEHMFSRFIPTAIPSTEVLWAAAPYVFSLALLNYLDTLMTALVMDKLTGERSRMNRELFAQGVATAAIVPFGGIPGAQATIRSVLLWREGATLRWASAVAGGLALLQVLAFQDLVRWIPQAVFLGVLVKVGIDVFDWAPLRLWLAQQRRASDDVPAESVRVSTLEVTLILGTTLVTIVADLNVAVFSFTLVFWILRWARGQSLDDLSPPRLASQS